MFCLCQLLLYICRDKRKQNNLKIKIMNVVQILKDHFEPIITTDEGNYLDDGFTKVDNWSFEEVYEYLGYDELQIMEMQAQDAYLMF